MERLTTYLRRVNQCRVLTVLTAIVAMHELWVEVLGEYQTTPPSRGWTLLMEVIQAELAGLYLEATETRRVRLMELVQHDRQYIFEDWSNPQAPNPHLMGPITLSSRPEEELRLWLQAQTTAQPGSSCEYTKYQGYCDVATCRVHFAPRPAGPGGPPARVVTFCCPIASGATARPGGPHTPPVLLDSGLTAPEEPRPVPHTNGATDAPTQQVAASAAPTATAVATAAPTAPAAPESSSTPAAGPNPALDRWSWTSEE